MVLGRWAQKKTKSIPFIDWYNIVDDTTVSHPLPNDFHPCHITSTVSSGVFAGKRKIKSSRREIAMKSHSPVQIGASEVVSAVIEFKLHLLDNKDDNEEIALLWMVVKVVVVNCSRWMVRHKPCYYYYDLARAIISIDRQAAEDRKSKENRTVQCPLVGWVTNTRVVVVPRKGRGILIRLK